MARVDGEKGVVLGPRAKEQPKRLSGCVDCGRLYEQFESTKHVMSVMHRGGWRIREAQGRLRNVCPAHVRQGDW